MTSHRRLLFLFLQLFILCIFLSSCSTLLTSTVIEPSVANLQQETDIELVCEGAPAYLLMIDSMVSGAPKDPALLRSAAQGYSGYAATLAECSGSAQRLPAITEKARHYGVRLLEDYLGPAKQFGSPEFLEKLAGLSKSDVTDVFWGTFGWLAWVTNEKGSPQAIADLVHIIPIMTRLQELDEGFQAGAIDLFFGAYYAATPVMFGGKPELARKYFEKALQFSKGRFLFVQTTYAETLARNSFDQQLHDRLLKEVLAFPLDNAPEYALSNRLAVRKARRLLAENYFGQ